MGLKKATRKNVKLKIGISAPSGYGKTAGALLMAYGITEDWDKIAVIDTENRSSELYAGSVIGGVSVGEFFVYPLDPDYTPEKYIKAINECVEAGIEVIIADSITHEWDGQGGCLEIVERLTKASTHKNSYISWREVTPRHKKFVDTILQCPAHFITTTRRKQEYDMSKNEHGKTIVSKVGTKEVQREGFEYELTLNLEIQNPQHFATASKDRTGLFDGRDPFVITPETGKMLMEWANKGVDPVAYAIESVNNAKNIVELTSIWNNNKPIQGDSKFTEAVKNKKLDLKPSGEKE